MNGETTDLAPELQKAVDEKFEKNTKSLLIADWVYVNGMWEHPKRQHQGLPMLFTFEQACKAQEL